MLSINIFPVKFLNEAYPSILRLRYAVCKDYTMYAVCKDYAMYAVCKDYTMHAVCKDCVRVVL